MSEVRVGLGLCGASQPWCLMEHAAEATKVLCIWDCCSIWLKTSEAMAYLVFDPFTELTITLCIVVNVIFMALDHYNIEYDENGGM